MKLMMSLLCSVKSRQYGVHVRHTDSMTMMMIMINPTPKTNILDHIKRVTAYSIDGMGIFFIHISFFIYVVMCCCCAGALTLRRERCMSDETTVRMV